MNEPIADLRRVLFHLSILLAASAGDAMAVQIEPNPNPVFSTISVTPPTPSENLTLFSNFGTVEVQASGTLRNADFFINSGTITNAGMLSSPGPIANLLGGQYVQTVSGTTQIDGELGNSGRVSNAGTITVGATGTIGETGRYFQFDPPPGPVTSPPPLTSNTGTFINGGTVVLASGNFINNGSVVNSGNFTVGTFAQVSGSGSYVQNASAALTRIDGVFGGNLSLQAGILTGGTGSIQGTLQNSGGILVPGNSGLGPLTITGQYVQGTNGTLSLNLAGATQGFNYGWLNVRGTGTAVTLGGNLKVGLLSGFSPLLGNVFNVLTCTGCAINADLRSVSLPTLASGLDWSVRLLDAFSTLQLAVVSTPTVSAPEPGTVWLVGAGFVGLVEWRRRSQKKACSARAPDV